MIDESDKTKLGELIRAFPHLYSRYGSSSVAQNEMRKSSASTNSFRTSNDDSDKSEEAFNPWLESNKLEIVQIDESDIDGDLTSTDLDYYAENRNTCQSVSVTRKKSNTFSHWIENSADCTAHQIVDHSIDHRSCLFKSRSFTQSSNNRFSTFLNKKLSHLSISKSVKEQQKIQKDLISARSSLDRKLIQMSASMASFLKLTLVGDGGVGKSCLILQYMYGDFVEEYEPTKADAYRRTITLQGDEVQIDILDTAGQEDYPAVRDGYLKHGDGFLLVFDLTNKETFESIKNHRENVLRVKSDDPQLPIILIGNKSDLGSSRRVATDEAASLAQNWGMAYIETSAKTRENVDRAFSEIFVKIKELKAERQRNLTQAGGNRPGKTPYYANSGMTREEEEAVRADSMRKRIKKWFKHQKKQCSLS